MRIVSALLAQTTLPTDVIANPWHWMGLSLKELLTLLGAVTLVTLFLFIWAVYFRKSPRQHSHHHSHHHSHGLSSSSGSQNNSNSEANAEKRHRRKRRRRREHRPRNPTLAETGGLPPLRSERPPDSLP